MSHYYEDPWLGGDGECAYRVVDKDGREIKSIRHSQRCVDNAFVFHAATGGDADCICGAERTAE